MDTKNQQNYFNNPVVIILLLALVGLGGYFLSSNKDSLKNADSKIEDSISADDLKPYLTGVVQVDCYVGQNAGWGSGTLWKIGGEHYVLTNHHVISTSDCDFMYLDMDNPIVNKRFYDFKLDAKSASSWNNQTDVALVKIGNEFGGNFNQDNIDLLNYSIGDIQVCPEQIALNSPVVIIGFPAFTTKYTTEASKATGWGDTSRTVTNGVISAYDTDVQIHEKLPHRNYFISAKMDSGNSGGIALSKVSGKLCLLGIPTWLNPGNYDTQGLVQNMSNVMFKN